MSLTIAPERIVDASDSPLLAAPAGWPRRALGEVVDIVNGFAFKSKQFSQDEGMPLIRIRDIRSVRTAVYYIGDFDKRYLVATGDLLVGMDGDFNCARWAGPKALLNQRVCKLVPGLDLDVDYLTFLLPGYLRAIHDATSSTTVTHLSSKDVARIPIPVPDVDTQRRAVEQLRTMDSAGHSVTSRLARAGRAADRLRLSVISAACRGRLTTDWRTARCLEGEGSDGLPATWSLTPLGSLVKVGTGATPLRSRADYYGGDIPWVTSGAVNAGSITEPTEYITKLALKETNAKLFPPGTMLVAMYGEGQTRGRVSPLAIEAATNQAVAALVFDSGNEQLRPYLHLFLTGNYERVRQLSFGGVQPNLSLGVIKSTQVPLPPPDEQQEIVKRAAVLLAFAHSMSMRVSALEGRVEQGVPALLASLLRSEGRTAAKIVEPRGTAAPAGKTSTRRRR